MTVSSTSNRVVYTGNGTTTSFPFAFKVVQASDLVVVYTDTTGTDSVLSPSVYGATGFGLDAGGTVAYPLTGSPIASGTKLTIYRDVPATQPASISNQGAMWPQVIETALDRLTFVAQKLADLAGRSLAIGATDSGTTLLPNAASRASRVLAFDASGNAQASDLTLAAIENGSVNAAASAAQAATSAGNAASSATAAAGSATAAAGSASSAATSATNAASSASAAAGSASGAATSASNAASSASAAAGSATSAASSATSASSSASGASTSATSAASSASGASASASTASSSASSANTSATNAAASATSAAASAATLSATSTTSNTPAIGSMTWTTQGGKSLGVGAYVMIASAGTPAVWAFGQVTAYSGTSLTVNVTAIGTASAKTDWNIWLAGAQGATGATGAAGSVTPPCGRLTLTSATPVLTGAITGAGTIYYALYNGNQVPLYDGVSTFVPTTFGELTNVLANSSTGKAGPAAATTNSNHDLFVWSDSGTPRLTRGPAWSSDTSRGTGAGTTELQRLNGIWTNKQAITNGPGANLGTYVGTVRTNGSSTVDWQPGGISSGGTAAVLGVWNAYNRISARGLIGDSTGTWNYSTQTIRPANNSITMRVSFIQGLQEEWFGVNYEGGTTNNNTTSVQSLLYVGYNSTTAFSGRAGVIANAPSSTAAQTATADYQVQQLGWGYMQALEYAIATGTTTWFGQNGGYQNGLTYLGEF